MMKAPELLSPAGTLEKMRYAYAYGADAVYAGQPRYSLRARNNEFRLEQLETGVREAHALGKKFYVASNLMPHNAKVKTYLADMEPVIAMQPDALIMADPGLIMLVREQWPEMPVHLSVQANTVNYAAVKFWQSLGLTRVILSRELSLEEIEEIKQRCPEMELEVFVHGALCIAYSGRCLLSGYFNHRDPNQGTCTNSCRWDYKVHEATETDSGDWQKIDFDFRAAMDAPAFADCGSQQRHPLADKAYLVEERQRPGELMPILEDEHGTYIMNSKDLRAIDDAVAGRPFDYSLLGELESLANRGYTDGFYQRHHTEEYQNYLRGHSESNRSQYVGDVVAYDAARGLAEIEVKNKFAVGDKLEIMQPAGNRVIELTRMENAEGEVMRIAPGAGYRVRIPLPEPAPQGLVTRLLDAA
jgi:putative protease